MRVAQRLVQRRQVELTDRPLQLAGFAPRQQYRPLALRA
jgi:hypothetical protein